MCYLYHCFSVPALKGWGWFLSLLELWKVSRSYLFLNFWANGEINCIKNIQSINSLVLVDNATTDWPRSVVLWLSLWLGVWCCCCAVLMLLCGLLLNTVCMVGDRSKNSLIALCDRNPNSKKFSSQTKSTKNVQFSKITHLLCYIFVSCFVLKIPNIFRKKTVYFLSVLYFR